jgi:hypothetical protein
MLQFTHSNNRYTSSGEYCRNYTIEADTLSAPALYYVMPENVEFESLPEAMEYCEAIEHFYTMAEECECQGVRAFDTFYGLEDTDIDPERVYNMGVVYCPTKEAINAFLQFVEAGNDCYKISGLLYLDYEAQQMDSLIFQLDRGGDSFHTAPLEFARLIAHLLK